MSAPRIVTVKEAAAALDISDSTVERDIAKGAPVAKRGSRGRKNLTLLDLEAYAAWRKCGRHSAEIAALTRRAAAVGTLPEVLADRCFWWARTRRLQEQFGISDAIAPHLLQCFGHEMHTAACEHLSLDATAIPEKLEAIAKRR